MLVHFYDFLIRMDTSWKDFVIIEVYIKEAQDLSLTRVLIKMDFVILEVDI